ncbi:MAG TPA: DUF1552 domain-containing protein [Polyangiaceae bacterium]|nr:DUF1552 domain-containing protein [Polyangiaceae bacterium]
MRHRLGRRTLLRSALGAAVGLPWLEAMAPRRASAQTAPPRRFVVMFSPNGTLPALWTPSGGETDFALSPILSPLAEHRDDLVIIQGVDQQGAGGDGHQMGIGGMLTGERLNPGPFGGFAGPSAGWAAGPSVDQRMAEVLGLSTQLPSLELGVRVGNADNFGRMCYRAANQPLPPEDDPAAVYARVFADLHTDPAVLERLRTRRKSILDAVMTEYSRVSQALGSADRQRLDAHLTAVRDIEARLNRPTNLDAAACADPVVPPLDAQSNDAYPEVGALQTDLLAMAFACDITRVASLQWSSSVADTRFTWLGIEEGHHELSHLGDDDLAGVDKLTRINQWYAGEFANLIAKLKAIPEGDGTVFDNTLLLWCNELAKGNTHSRKDAPYVLAGSAGGALQTGRFLRFEGERPHNDLLVSLLQVMGLPDETFGNPEWCTGPLTGLV